nr:TrbG/VirB9 family P-type conjugative transfer protein [Erythrobacter ani]
MPSTDTPRIQSVRGDIGGPILLTALPETSLTVMLEPGETVTRAVLGGNRSWSVTVSSEADSFQVLPARAASPANLTIETDRRMYDFMLETGLGLQAAYLVRLEFDRSQLDEFPVASPPEPIGELVWSYRLRGDRSVRPLSIRDDGSKTVIEYAPGQPLPAVFAIGASGDEEVVNGYMRGEKFVIDRIHQRLVFRIDKEKATARRNRKQDAVR